MGLYWVPGHAGVLGNEVANKLARDGSVPKFVGPEPSLGVSRQNIRIKIKCRMNNQHLPWWQGLSSTHRQYPNLIAKTRLLSFNRTKSRVLINLLTGHNTLRRDLHLMRPTHPLCRRCGDEGMKPRPTFSVNMKLWLHSDLYIWAPFSWIQKTLRVLSLGAIWNFSKGTGSP